MQENTLVTAPGWLLQEIGLESGFFNEEKTIVTGRRGNHLNTIWELNTPRDGHVVYLTKLQTWNEIKKRLTDEGYIGI